MQVAAYGRYHIRAPFLAANVLILRPKNKKTAYAKQVEDMSVVSYMHTLPSDNIVFLPWKPVCINVIVYLLKDITA